MSHLHNNVSHQRPTMRAKDAAAFLSVGVSTFWRWVAEGKIPKGTKLAARTTVWRRSDIEAFLKEAEEASIDN